MVEELNKFEELYNDVMSILDDGDSTTYSRVMILLQTYAAEEGIRCFIEEKKED